MKEPKQAGETLAQKIERGRQAGVELSGVTDELNVALSKAEKALAKLHLGVRGSVDITDPEASNNGFFECIEFRKDSGAWGIFYVTGNEMDQEERLTPILKTPREVRFLAVEVLPRLVDALVEAAEEQVRIGKERVVFVEELVKEIGS